jgi:ATP-binding cassette subfamily C protein
LKSLRFFATIYRRAPLKVTLSVLMIFVVGGLDGVGFALFLPLIEVFTKGTGTHVSSGLQAVRDAVARLGIPMTLPAILALIVAVFGVKNVLLYISKWFTEKIGIGFYIDMKKRIVAGAMRADWNFFLREKVGALTNAVDAQTLNLAQAFRQALQVVSESIHLAVYCALAVWVSWQMFLISVAGGALCYLLLGRFVTLTRRNAQKIVAVRSESQGLVIENFSGMKYIKGNQMEKERSKRMFGSFDELKDRELQNQKYNVVMDTAPDFVMACLMSLFLLASYYLVKVPMENALVLMMILYRGGRRLTILQLVLQRLANHLPSYDFCEEMLRRTRASRERAGGLPFEGLRAGIELRDVTFAYADEPVVSGLSLRFKKDQLTAVIGRSGSGKTTILDMLLGFLRPEKGAVLVDGANLESLDLASWRRRIAYVPQDAFMVHGTIEENIRLGSADAPAEELERCSKLAHAHEFIQKQAKGYQTVIGDRGIRLSGGQRQRIALARALLKKPQILLLDEATSALDNESERMVQEAIRELKGSLTIIVVAHRFSTIKDADMIYALDGGKVAESGRAAELSGRDGVFGKLYALEEKAAEA